jgi:dimethylhistidine N-methyltransferase
VTANANVRNLGLHRHEANSLRLVDQRQSDPERDRAALLAGLMATPATLAPRYFYDELGCALYGAICALPEYYPTRTEVALFERYRGPIVQAIGRATHWVDLGSGDSVKAEGWFPFAQPASYTGVDVALPALSSALTRIGQHYPQLPLTGLATDFFETLDLEAVLPEGPVTFFYPGSSIGNFTPPAARAFLKQVAAHCRRHAGSSLLIGVDGIKSKQRLDLAYDDPLGVTAAFNLNALRHVNRAVGADFDVRDFAHRGFFDSELGRIEMHLVARRDVRVSLDEGRFERVFAEGESIHTENSYKYSREAFAKVLMDSGFVHLQSWSHGVVEADDYHVFVGRV